MSESNESWAARRAAAVPRGLGSSTSAFVDRALNTELWDIEGRRYIDFAGGIAVLAVGHRHPRVMAAVAAQLDRFTHTAFQVAPYQGYVRLAERLNDLAPIDGPAKTIFFTSGAEATENAVKIARAATGRSAIIAFVGGFHGRTLLASAMTGKTAPYKLGYGPMPSEIYHAPYPAPSTGFSAADSLAALEDIFAADVPADRVAAIIIEPIQGEGGFHVADAAFLQGLRALCDRNGILLIADEVQTGFARTGRMFAIEHSGISPDLIAVAKSLGGGLPIAGVIGRADVMDAPGPGGLGGTYGGPPLSCAAANATLDVIEDEKLIDRAVAIGARIRARLEAFAKRNDLVPISEIRGLGAMIGFDIVTERGGRSPDGDTVKQVCARALAAGLIVLSCGRKGETVRLLMPLTASDEIIDEGLDILEGALAAPAVADVVPADLPESEEVA